MLRKTHNEVIRNMVLDLFSKCLAANIPVTVPMLQAKAKQVAKELGVSNFKASNGWLQRFLSRNNISCRIFSDGESAAVDVGKAID